MAGRPGDWPLMVTGIVGQSGIVVKISLRLSPTKIVSSDFAPVMDG